MIKNKFSPAMPEKTVATVDKNEKITAVGAGTTIIANVGGKTATYELTVEGILRDIDKDNMVTAFDAYKILEKSVGIVDSSYWK